MPHPRRTAAILLTLTLTGSSLAQVPETLNYQGRLITGTNLVNGTVGLNLSLYTASSGGTLVYQDSNTVTVVDGLYSTYIGDDTVTGNLYDALTNAQVWLQVNVNGVDLSPRERLVSVPYARRVDGLHISGINNVVLGSAVSSNSLTWYVEHGVIAGGMNNRIVGNIVFKNKYSTISGGTSNSIFPGSEFGTIGGGAENSMHLLSRYGTIGGGMGNTIDQEVSYGTIAGGWSNILHAMAFSSTIGGGRSNVVANSSFTAVIAGGLGNGIGSNSSEAVVSGGDNNNIGNNARESIIAGGAANTIQDGAVQSGVGGGALNTIRSNALNSVIGGGRNNSIDDGAAYATVPGGQNNTVAADYGQAAGRRAKALHEGSFVWADATDSDVASTTNNEFVIRAKEGVRITEDAGAAKPVELGRRFRDNAIIAWARVTSVGVLDSEFGIASIAHPATGHYEITLDASPANNLSLIPVVTCEIDGQPNSAATVRIVSYDTTSASNISVYINNGTFAAVNNDFTIIVTGR
jgi:hypothetical protein